MFIRFFVVYGAVVETLRRPPPFARSPWAQMIMNVEFFTIPPLARKMVSPVGEIISDVQFLFVVSREIRVMATVLLLVLGETRPG